MADINSEATSDRVVINVEVTVQACDEPAEEAAARQWLANRISDVTGLPVNGVTGEQPGGAAYAVVGVALTAD